MLTVGVAMDLARAAAGHSAAPTPSSGAGVEDAGQKEQTKKAVKKRIGERAGDLLRLVSLGRLLLLLGNEALKEEEEGKEVLIGLAPGGPSVDMGGASVAGAKSIDTATSYIPASQAASKSPRSESGSASAGAYDKQMQKPTLARRASSGGVSLTCESRELRVLRLGLLRLLLCAPSWQFLREQDVARYWDDAFSSLH